MAMAEVGEGDLFGTLCYSLNITSLNDLENYNDIDSTILHTDVIYKIKKKLKRVNFNFENLQQVINLL